MSLIVFILTGRRPAATGGLTFYNLPGLDLFRLSFQRSTDYLSADIAVSLLLLGVLAFYFSFKLQIFWQTEAK